MSPLNSNSKNFSLYNKSKQYCNHSSKMFGFLFFFLQSMYCLFTKNVCSFFLFFFSYAAFNNVQVSLSFFFFLVFFFLFLHFHCPVALCFCFGFHFFFFKKLLIQCPFFFSISYLPLCLYLNTITIGLLPSLFNFSLYYHKLSLIYNTTFSIAYEHSSFFFSFHKISRFFFLNNPNFYKFCQHFPIQNISEPANLRHTWFCQNFAHLLIISKTLFKISSPITISKLHSRGNSQNTCLPHQTQKTSVS